MTNQVAIEQIQERVDFYEKCFPGVVPEYYDSLVMAIAALEKQKPKAPVEINWEYDYFKCPSCGKLITSTTGIDAHKYCLECGQALAFGRSGTK